MTEADVKLLDLEGGTLRNAIPREAYAVVAVPEHTALLFETALAQYVAAVKALYAPTEPNLTFSVSQAALQPVVDIDAQVGLLAPAVAEVHGGSEVKHGANGVNVVSHVLVVHLAALGK